MPLRVPSSYPLVVLGLVLATSVRAEVPLAGKSPFLPSGGSAGSAVPTAGAPLEFRGTMVTSEGLKVRIVEPSRKTGAWLLVNERDPSLEFVVKQYDSEHDTVKVEYQGQTLTLAQHVARVASAGAPQNPAQNFQLGGIQGMPPSIAQSVVVNPTPADEQRRLDAVAAEVARRRAMREQAAQQVSQGVSLAPQVIQQQQDQVRAQRQAQSQNPPAQNTGGGRNPKTKNR